MSKHNDKRKFSTFEQRVEWLLKHLNFLVGKVASRELSSGTMFIALSSD